MAVPTKCPQCGSNKWITSPNSHFLSEAKKNPEQQFVPNVKRGLVVKSFVCTKCFGVVFVKEVYPEDLK